MGGRGGSGPQHRRQTSAPRGRHRLHGNFRPLHQLRGWIGNPLVDELNLTTEVEIIAY